MNGENVEAVIEIAAEGALDDELGEITIGGGDDADVDALRLIAAEALELLLLKNAKELGLKLEREIGDFIKKERAAVGEFKTSDFLGESAGEGTSLMAEKLGFKKAAGDGGAIDLDESALAARAEIVNGACDELLAGAGFTGDENGGASGSDELDLGKGTLERQALTNDFLEIELGANFFL